MHALEFVRRGKAGEVQPIYAVIGEDAYLRREALGIIARAALGAEADELAVSRFAGDQASLADVLDEVRMLPFLAPRRVVVVEDADKFVTAHRKELEAFAAQPAERGTLVLQVKSWTSTTKLAKLIDKNGLTVDCRSPKERELPEWLVALAREAHSVRLEPDAAALLVELVGGEVGLLASEVEKLATYVGGRKRIEYADVARMVGAGKVETIWKTIEAATTGKGAEALHQLDMLLTSGEPPVRLLAAMAYSLQKVHYAGKLRQQRFSHEAACKQAGIYPFGFELTRRQHAHLGPARVDRLPDLLLRADLDLKGFSMLDPRIILERLILTLAEPRKN